MAQKINVPGVGSFTFPDDMPDEEIKAQIQRTVKTGEGLAGGDVSREQRLARIEELEAEQAAVAADDPSFVKDVVGGTVADIRGVPEAGLELLTGGAATAAGGLAAIPATAIAAATGQEDPAQAGRDVLGAVQEAGTFQPRTEVGQRASEAVQAPLAAVERFADVAGEITGDPEDVLGATAVKTAILGAPALFGLRRGAVTRAAPKGPTPRAQVAVEAAKEGYRTPPSVRGEGGAAGLAEGLGGKIKTKQEAVELNQAVTNNLAKRAIGLTDDVPLTVEALQAVRSTAGQAFETLKGAGEIAVDTAYRRDLSRAVGEIRSAAKDFPGVVKDKLVEMADGMKLDSFDAGSGVAAMRQLRNEADIAFRAGDAAGGRAYRDLSNAIEGALERHLERTGTPESLTNFRNARQQIAETYTVEKALQGRTTGDINASILATELKRGKPLSGDLRQIADFANTFPTVSTLMKAAPQKFSPLDLAVGGGSLGVGGTGLAAGFGPAGLIPLGFTLSRPLLRSASLKATPKTGAKGKVRPTKTTTGGGAASRAAGQQREGGQ